MNIPCAGGVTLYTVLKRPGSGVLAQIFQLVLRDPARSAWELFLPTTEWGVGRSVLFDAQLGLARPDVL